MAGIYIHIPFCRQKCSYCDFHFSTDSSYAGRMVRAIARELEQRAIEARGEIIETIYLGGGTPSVLSFEQLSQILGKVRDVYTFASQVEVTLEANPEDITDEVLAGLKSIGVNRLSMGIQSFDDDVLQSMNRSHDSQQALAAVEAAQKAGISNISVDIIYGLPGKSIKDFSEDLRKFIALGVPHISAYALTIEKGTLYHHQVKKGSLVMPDDDDVEEQFFHLRDELVGQGYEHYEVSNFAVPGHISRHNSAYWRGVPYLGFGPSAHSYDGQRRAWNLANNHGYMKAMEDGSTCGEEEVLDKNTRYNEYILTRLRTKWGLDLGYVQEEFGVDIVQGFPELWKRFEGKYSISDGHLILDPEGLILADGLASDLFQIA